MDERVLSERLDRIERRLATLEGRLKVGGVTAVQAEPPPIPVTPVEPLPDEDEVDDGGVPVPVYEASSVPRPDPGGDVERAFGLRGTAWAGAVLLAVAAGLGVKFLYDRGLLDAPPGVRLGGAAMLALAVFAGGVALWRRLGDVTAAAASAAGLAGLFVCAWAGHGYYGLYAAGLAFALAAAVAVLGVAAAVWRGSEPVATLALLGGALAPLTVGGDGSAAGLTLYTLALFALGHGAAVVGERGRGPWWAVRLAASAAAVVWLGLLVADESVVGLVGLTLAMAVGQADVLRLRGRDAASAGLYAVLANLAVAVGMLVALDDRSPWLRAGLLLAQASAAAVVALRLRGVIGLTYAAVAAALVVATAPVVTGGAAPAGVWAGMALAAAVAATRTERAGPLHVAAGVIWALSALAVLKFAGENPATTSLLGRTLPGWAVPALAVGAVGQAIALLIGPRNSVAATLLHVAGLAVIAAGLLGAAPDRFVLAMTVALGVLLGLAIVLRRPALGVVVAGATGLLLAAWVADVALFLVVGDRRRGDRADHADRRRARRAARRVAARRGPRPRTAGAATASSGCCWPGSCCSRSRSRLSGWRGSRPTHAWSGRSGSACSGGWPASRRC